MTNSKRKKTIQKDVLCRYVWGSLLVGFCLSVVGLIFAEEGKQTLGSIEVTGEAKDRLEIEKISPKIELKPEDIVVSATDQTEKLLERSKPIPSTKDFQQFDRLNSQQTAQPWLVDFSKPPLIRFYPSLAESAVKSWKLEITNEEGHVIRTLRGKGNPVKEIVWWGRDEKGRMIKVGSHYSFRFVTTDEFDQTHTTLGKAFKLNHLQYRDKKNLYLEISNDWFFDEDQLKPRARSIFERSLDVLREYSRYPMTLELYTQNPRRELVRKRQKMLSKRIAKKMLLLPEDVRYSYSKIGDRGDILRYVIRLKK